jgi:hypothetical protein
VTSTDTISDVDVWADIAPDDLWIYDRLILARRLGYVCGPAGVAPAQSDHYVVRPIMNWRMMGRGAEIRWIAAGDQDSVPDGWFWCQRFSGRHLSFDYQWGRQVLCAEGFRDDPQRLDRFSRWQRTSDIMPVPPLLESIALRYQWLNIETVGGLVIEVHLRYNDDFRNHDADVIYPVWREQWYPSAAGDRVGFVLGPRRLGHE